MCSSPHDQLFPKVNMRKPIFWFHPATRNRALRLSRCTCVGETRETIDGRPGAADYFIPPRSIASTAKSIAAFADGGVSAPD
jgi:hypothetical protein